jgi:hypothetical protein
VQAPVEIRYEGAVLAKAVAPSGSLEEGGTLFLPLPDPMPVGTRLELRSGSDTALVRVVKVTESADAALAGIAVRTVGTHDPVELPLEPEPAAAPAAHQSPSSNGAVARTITGASGAVEIGDGDGDGEDTTSTSEYPALSNGAGAKKRQRKRKR